MLLHATTWRRAGRLFFRTEWRASLSLRDRADIVEIVSCVPYAICPLIYWTAIFFIRAFVPFGRSCLGFDLCMARAGGAHYRQAKVVSVVEESRRSPSLPLPLFHTATLVVPPSLPSEGGPPSNGRSRQAVLLLLSGGGGGRNEGERRSLSSASSHATSSSWQHKRPPSPLPFFLRRSAWVQPKSDGGK